jgi:hypothetical protein
LRAPRHLLDLVIPVVVPPAVSIPPVPVVVMTVMVVTIAVMVMVMVMTTKTAEPASENVAD